jgi:hypothetical protein
MPTLSNPRHEHFALGVARGLTPTKAYVAAGFKGKGAHASANRLRRQATICDRLAELQVQVEQASVESVREVIRLEVTERNSRIRALQDLADRWRRLIEERAADPRMKEVPGGTTGLLMRTKKMLGSGPTAYEVDEYKADAAASAEFRDTLMQAAKEMGQWQERSQVTPIWDGRLESLTAEQRDRILHDLAEAEFPGDPDAVGKALAAVKDSPVQ